MATTNIDKKQAEQTAIIKVFNKAQQKITNVIIPSGITVGVSNDSSFDGGIAFKNTVAPPNTNLKLYVVGSTLYFNGTEVGTGGGGGTPGGSDTQVQFNDSSTFGGDDGFTFVKSTEKLTVTSGSFGSVGINDTAPKTALSVMNDYDSVAFTDQLAQGEGGGNIVKWGNGTLAAGKLYYLNTSNTWTDSNSTSVSGGASQLLGVAMGSSPTSNGVLLSGYVRIGPEDIGGTAQSGLPVYVSTTAKLYTFTAPSSSGNFVRIVGHCVSAASDILLYFNPDPTWVEIT